MGRRARPPRRAGLRPATPASSRAFFRPEGSCLLLALLLCAGAACAQDARAIVEESQRRAQTSSTRYEGLLRVADAQGRITEKRWRFDRIGSHGASRVVLRFLSPPEVKDVAVLLINHTDRSADQWMWTPALQRERRITLQDRSTRFFGTDFSFEDMEERDAAQYDYRSLGEEAQDGEPCWRIEARPGKTLASQYASSRLWIRKGNYAVARIDNYIGDRVARRLQCGALENVQGIWTARLLDMSDLARGGRTTLRIEKLEYNLPMKAEDFTLQALRLGCERRHLSATSQIFSRRDFPSGPSTSRVTVKSPPRVY